VTSPDLLSKYLLTVYRYLLAMELRFDAMLRSNLGSESTDAGQSKCSPGPQVPDSYSALFNSQWLVRKK